MLNKHTAPNLSLKHHLCVKLTQKALKVPIYLMLSYRNISNTRRINSCPVLLTAQCLSASAGGRYCHHCNGHSDDLSTVHLKPIKAYTKSFQIAERLRTHSKCLIRGSEGWGSIRILPRVGMRMRGVLVASEAYVPEANIPEGKTR